MITDDLYKVCTTLEEVSDLQNKYKYFEAPIKNFSVLDDYFFGIKLADEFSDIPNTALDTTVQGMASFCDILHIPYPFAQYIPIELFQVNVNRLKETEKIVRVCYRDNVVVNMIDLTEKSKKLNVQTVETSELLEYFNNEEKYKFTELRVGDWGAVIDMIHYDLGKVKDKIEIGYRIINPFTMLDNCLRMSLLTYIPSGGKVTLPKDFGKVNLPLSTNNEKKIKDSQFYTDTFKNKIDEWIGAKYSLGNITDMFVNLDTKSIKYRFLRLVFNKVKSFDEDMFKRTFEVDWEKEKDFYKEKFDHNEAVDSPYIYGDVIKDLALEAKKLGILRSLELESYFSKAINLMRKQDDLYPIEERKNEEE